MATIGNSCFWLVDFYTPVFKTGRIMVYHCPSVRPFHMSRSNLRTPWPIHFKLRIVIGIYSLAVCILFGEISIFHSRVMGKKVFTNIVWMLTTSVSCALDAAVYLFVCHFWLAKRKILFRKYISYFFHVFSEERDHILILNILFFNKLRQKFLK